MNRQAKFSSSSFSIFFVLLFVVICQTVSSYKLLRHHKFGKPMDQEVGDDVETQNSLLLRFMKLNARNALHNELEQSLPSSVYAKRKSEVNVASTEPPFNTSCGKVNCAFVADYPEEEVKKIYEEKYKKKELRATGESVFNPVLITRSNLMPSEYPARGVSGRALHQDFHHIVQVMPDCDRMGVVTYPRESVDETNKPIILMTLQPDENWGPIAQECTAPNKCKDSKTPDNMVNICETKIKTVNLLVYDEKEERKDQMRQVKIADGCDCKLVKERHIFL